MKLTEDVANAGFVLNGADDELAQKRKNTVSLPSDVMNINGPERTQLGDVAERNRQAAKDGVSVQSQVGGKTLRDEALARKAAKAASGQEDKGWTARGSVHGGTGKETPYGAVRDDFASPATQGDLNAVLTDDPADVHTGGIVSPGRRIYGDLPEEDSAFYIKQKFDEVEPYPLVMPDGKEYMTNTSNLRKAEWQYWANIVEAPSLNWAGYYNLGEKPSEPWVQTAARGAINLFPMLAVRSGQQLANVVNYARWGFDALREDPRAAERYYERQKLITDTVHDYLDASQLYFSDASEEGANKYAYIIGQTIGSVGVASLGTKAAVLALSLGEGLSDAAVTQQATAEMGMSPSASFFLGAGAGVVSGALSFLPEWVYPNAIDDLAKKTGKTLLRMAVRSPGDIAKGVAERSWKRVILEGLTEVGQEISSDVFSSGFDSENLEMRWDEKAAILIASLVMGGAGTYHQISKAKKFEDGLREFDTRMREMQKQFVPAFAKIIEESKGMFTEEQLDQILTVIKNPDFARQMTNIIRGAVIANFDKFTPEQMKSMLDKIKSWKPDVTMFKEFSILEQKMDDLLRDSGLTAAQKERFRMYMRGTAAWQVVHMGTKPSEVRLPLKVSNVPPKGVPSSAAGYTSNNGIIYVTTRSASEPVTALHGVAPEVNTTNKKARKSANMAGIMANANMENTDTEQTVGEAFMTHEMTHWIKDQTGLKDVEAYMKALKNVVDTMVPGLIESYTKQPSRGGNKAEKKAAKKNRNSVDLAEAYAYAMQYAGLQAKEIFGVEGEVADAMTFLNMMLKASAITSKLSPELKKLYDFFEDTMKANKEAMQYLLAEIPSEQLRGAIKSFVETGDPSYLTVEGIRALDAALNSIVDAETSDILGKALPSRVEVVDFMNAVNTYYSDKAKAEREAERAARDEAIKEADAIVGIAEEEVPVINTVEDAVVEGVMDEVSEFDEATKALLSSAKALGIVDDDMTPEQFSSLSSEEQTRIAKETDAAAKVEMDEVNSYKTGDRPGYEPGEKAGSSKVAADQDVKGWVDSKATGPTAEDRTRATANIEEMSEQKLLEWRVHIPEIIRTELTTSVDDDLELVWSDSSDEKPFKFSSAVRKDPQKRAQLHARLKQYYKTIVSEVNRRIESGEMSESGEQFINKNGLFAVWNPNMLWSDDYVTHLANKIAGRLEGQVATEAEKQLYRAIRAYETAVGYLYDDNASMLEPQEKTELAIQYLDELSRELYSIEVGEDAKVDGFIYGLSDASADKFAGREIAKQYEKAIIPMSTQALSRTPYYRNRSLWLREGLLKRVQNRVNYLATKINEDMYRDDFGTELRDIEISDEIKAGVSAKRAKAVREELGSLKKAFLDAKAEHKKALDTFNAQPTRENNGKLRKATEAAKVARNEVIRAAQRHAEVLEHVPVSPDGVNYPSIARFFSPKRLGGDFIHQNAQDAEGNDLLLKTDESKWAQFINPARPERAVEQVHPIFTPTPLEQIELESGFTFADAQKVVADAGLKIPKLDLSVVTPEKIARYYDDGVSTFSRVYARLLDQVVSWGGAESLDYATRMRVLVGIDMAKQAARDVVGEYQISKEIGFLMNPTRGAGITASAIELDQSKKGAELRAENAKQGYIAVANPYELRAGDQVAFAKGNKIVKAVVSYVMPVGANKAVFLRHLVDVSKVDLANMTDKQISALGNKMVEDIISASDLSKVAVMQKVAVKGDAEKIGKMFDAYDKVMGSVQRDNWTLEALASVPPETLQGEIAADILENMQSVYDPYENSDEDDFGGNGMYAIMPDIVPSTPVIDPGKFVTDSLGATNPNTTNPVTFNEEEYERFLGDIVDFEARINAGIQLTQDQARSAVMDVAINAAKGYLRDLKKPNFTAVMNDAKYSGLDQARGVTLNKQFKDVYDGIMGTKTSKFLYWIGSSTGLDRKLALNIGQENAQKSFDFIGAASVAQQEKESRMQAMIDNAVNDVFDGKRTAYDRWRIGIKNDKVEVMVEGAKQKISEAEIMSLYAMKLQSDSDEAGHAKSIEAYKAGDPNDPFNVEPVSMEEYKKRKTQFKRAAAPFGGVDAANALIEQLSPESKKFVEIIGSFTIRSVSQHPEWVPAVDFIQYRGSGWASRKKNKVDYVAGLELVNGDAPLAALDYFDSITKAISKYAMDTSGLRTQLENLQMIFEFDKRVDRSKFAPIAPGSLDEQLFNEMSARSKLMRDKLAEKIGARMADAFIRNIEYDLKNPAFLDDVAATPEAKWFGRLSRSSGASVLMLNIKQGLQNLGNYHRLFGLSGSNMLKYYTTDWVKAVAHTREAWALMKQNPELLRRLKQAGLSEHMMRVVDENADSIFTDIQAKLLEHGRSKASNVTAFLGTVSNMATKWGMAPNVFGDALGIAWGNYAVYENVRSQVSAANKPALLARRDTRDVEAIIDEMTRREIGNYINSHIASSNYMARSMFTKMMNKMGLGAFVMFTNDQLQGFGSLAQAISVLQNSKNKVELERARKDIMSWAVSTVRYIAIKAGWYGALASMAMGKDLTDDEMDYIYSSTISEAVMQMGGWHQLSNLGVAPVLRAIIDGERLGPSIVSVSAAGRGISALRRGDWWDFASEAASMTVFPVANGLGRIVEAANYIMSANEHEQQVGWKMLGGSSKGGAMESLGLSDKNEDEEVKPKKKLKKDGE